MSEPKSFEKSPELTEEEKKELQSLKEQTGVIRIFEVLDNPEERDKLFKQASEFRNLSKEEQKKKLDRLEELMMKSGEGRESVFERIFREKE